MRLINSQHPILPSTVEHEVDVALLFKINENRKYHINVSEKSLSPGLVLFSAGRAWTLRTGTSWHGSVIVAENEESESQVRGVSSIKLKPKTAN